MRNEFEQNPLVSEMRENLEEFMNRVYGTSLANRFFYRDTSNTFCHSKNLWHITSEINDYRLNNRILLDLRGSTLCLSFMAHQRIDDNGDSGQHVGRHHTRICLSLFRQNPH